MVPEPSPTKPDGPPVAWLRERPVAGRGRRVVGLLLGLVVGGGCAAVAGVLLVVARSTGPVAQASFILALVATLGAPAGAIAGWLLGPAAWRARDATDWLLVVAGLSVAAVIAGLVTYSAVFAVSSLLGGGIDALPGALGLGIVVILFGLLVAPFALPAATIGAIAWAGLMSIVRGSGERATQQ